MSTNKTTNYQLHSWLPTDEFHLTEINENFALLDAALRSEVGELSEQMNVQIKSKARIVAGKYVGNGALTRHIDLVGRPSAVLIEHYGNQRMGGTFTVGGLSVNGEGLAGYITYDDTGFTVQRSTLNDSSTLNTNNITYFYIAFYL